MIIHTHQQVFLKQVFSRLLWLIFRTPVPTPRAGFFGERPLVFSLPPTLQLCADFPPTWCLALPINMQSAGFFPRVLLALQKNLQSAGFFPNRMLGPSKKTAVCGFFPQQDAWPFQKNLQSADFFGWPRPSCITQKNQRDVRQMFFGRLLARSPYRW